MSTAGAQRRRRQLRDLKKEVAWLLLLYQYTAAIQLLYIYIPTRIYSYSSAIPNVAGRSCGKDLKKEVAWLLLLYNYTAAIPLLYIYTPTLLYSYTSAIPNVAGGNCGT